MILTIEVLDYSQLIVPNSRTNMRDGKGSITSFNNIEVEDRLLVKFK